MGYVIKMPKLGLEMERGTVLEWKVDTGASVTEGEPVAEVESEKSIGEVEAREDGVLRRVYVEVEESVPPGTPIGILAAADADIADLEAEAEAELEAEAPEAVPAEAATAETTGEPAAESGGGGESGTADADAAASAGDADEVKASPRARERADELGVDVATVEGTGFEGSVTEADVEAAAEAGEPAAEPEDVKASPRARERADELGVDLTAVEGTGFEGSVTEEDVEAAAEAEGEAEPATAEAGPPAAARERPGARWLSAAEPAMDRYERVTATAGPAAATGLVETVEAVRTAFEERVTTTDVLLVVASAALSDHPAVNGTYAESTHQVQRTQDVALVADLDGDPIGGVVTGVERRSLSELVEAREGLDGGDGASDGATFTLANAAEAGSEGRLVNPPAVAALEVDPTGQRAVPGGEGVDLRPLVTASLTYDARALGGNEARAFLEAFFERAERASDLVLGSYRGTE